MDDKVFVLPNPIIDVKEINALDSLTDRYNKLTTPNKFSDLTSKVADKVPEKIKTFGGELSEALTGQEVYLQAMKIATEGFKIIESQAAKFSIKEETILRRINEIVPDYEVNSINEVCLARSYNLAKIANSNRPKDISAAFVEGGACGYVGLAGIPFNLVLSIFLYYRAVQSVAMCYGFDVKNDPAELVIAGEVFAKAMNPAGGVNSEMSDIVTKIMVISKGEAIKKTVDKGWTEMASRGGIELLLTQMRALAHASAKKALDNAGKKGLEAGIFRDLFEQIGKQLTQNSIKKAIPYISAVIGALMDTAQMNRVLEYADIFYQKRFILEKEKRIDELMSMEIKTVQIDFEDVL